MLRVDGSLAKYGREGVANIRFAKSKRYITADLQVPEVAWKPRQPDELKKYLARQVLVALQACIARLTRDGHEVRASALIAEVEHGVAEYLQQHSPHKHSDA